MTGLIRFMNILLIDLYSKSQSSFEKNFVGINLVSMKEAVKYYEEFILS